MWQGIWMDLAFGCHGVNAWFVAWVDGFHFGKQTWPCRSRCYSCLLGLLVMSYFKG